MKIKICCISSQEEADKAIAAGADILGLVARMPSGPGVIPDERIAAIAKAVPRTVRTFLLTAETEADAIVDHWKRCRTSAIQLVDLPDPDAYDEIIRQLPRVELIQAVHVEDRNAVLLAEFLNDRVDALLLDSGSPARGQLGGTGRVHDWGLSRRIVDNASIPVFLAGGLRADNVGQAIEEVQPQGVDICSGVRENGQLSGDRLRAFIATVRQAHS